MVLAELCLWMLRNLLDQTDCKRNVAFGKANVVFNHVLVHFKEFVIQFLQTKICVSGKSKFCWETFENQCLKQINRTFMLESV
jgi:hypothetical protein